MDESQCRSCSPGFYCSETGLSAVSGPCLAGQKWARSFSYESVMQKFSFLKIWLKSFSSGYYCLEGSQTATPMSSASGDVCPAGYYCVEGSHVPTPCPVGSYQNETGGKGTDDCKPCPIGKQEMKPYKCNLCSVQIYPSALLKMFSLFKCLCQARSRTYQAKESVIPVLLGSTAWVPAIAGLFPAQLATSAPGIVQTVSLSPAPRAPTAPIRVSPTQVKNRYIILDRKDIFRLQSDLSTIK